MKPFEFLEGALKKAKVALSRSLPLLLAASPPKFATSPSGPAATAAAASAGRSSRRDHGPEPGVFLRWSARPSPGFEPIVFSPEKGRRRRSVIFAIGIGVLLVLYFCNPGSTKLRFCCTIPKLIRGRDKPKEAQDRLLAHCHM
ncbi:hypothetical protein NL676_024681 [Syzygium grande]|nr:hypothetical protein NL676_024681 [Syzygium grande]